MTSATGAIIYKAFAPTIKMMICITIGFVLTKKGIFAPANAKGVSILSLNVGLPALVFGSMISAFTSENIKAFGSLILIAILYMILGFICAWFVREFFFVPPDFRYGILVMGTISNWGNLPTAVVQTLAKSAPFDPDTDVELGIAYIAVFILAMNVCLFPMGLHKMCAWDFRQENLIKPRPPPVKERWGKRLRAIKGVFRKDKTAKKEDGVDDEKIEEVTNGLPSPKTEIYTSKTSTDYDERGEEPSEMIQRARFISGADVVRKKSRASSFHSMMETTRPIPPTAPLDASGIAEPCHAPSTTNPDQLLPVCSRQIEAYQYHHPVTPAPSVHKPSWSQRLLKLAREFVMPLTVAIIMGIICSVIPPIKALFVTVDGWSGTRIPYAPDGNPPLSFITDTATFLGGMTIPAGLILLGASFGRLKMPKKWSDMPIGAIIAMMAFKMIIIPVFGVFVVQAFRDDTGLYPKDDKMRTFVSILLAGTPAAVNQLVITQLYNPEGTADTLSSFLALQYVLMPILSTILAAVALYITEQV
ncbi:hypothetical protein CNBJ0750 [Cryptococcus deneoformans B-3501A]|uniref:Membrane protein, putative n=1 Tax=Cryptococcus deneoformans (strain JEC21 / ATCC MYA-565) TaxID=214684 RepID=Q5KA75_CRYD1|nr:membrane protein, putative [Cryptococcus neoformans var. neoformans JEC21]XP_773080.1 hypothetical protein CNBJ0750 [Cryptococcus neoformans var. neoformans B-3501A]AAW46043.1 membrane protein, putative [Cryptococcus neoformans var. neoformans JEC21]EAL18433.1 hypothetical protein CNBJ0750 [Cryptococcus neoformans var. neoformans B-3501A]